MLTTLLLAMAVTGQSDYNLLAQENVPAAQATVRTATGDYADEKVAALADARAKVRAYSRGLAEARASQSTDAGYRYRTTPACADRVRR